MNWGLGDKTVGGRESQKASDKGGDSQQEEIVVETRRFPEWELRALCHERLELGSRPGPSVQGKFTHRNVVVKEKEDP